MAQKYQDKNLETNILKITNSATAKTTNVIGDANIGKLIIDTPPTYISNPQLIPDPNKYYYIQCTDTGDYAQWNGYWIGYSGDSVVMVNPKSENNRRIFRFYPVFGPDKKIFYIKNYLKC
mgnify:CR=1 FL=1